MEYFDVFSKYYISNIRQLHKQLPGSLRDLLPVVNTMPTARRSSEIPKQQVEDMLQTEDQISESFIAIFEKSKPTK